VGGVLKIHGSAWRPSTPGMTSLRCVVPMGVSAKMPKSSSK
jgi:hypothetical protein